jgi:hypothetical protein
LIKSVKQIERDIPTNWEIVSYVEDIGRMFSQIRRRNKSYEVQFDGDIKNLHDNLSVDNDKARIQNHKINYTDKELTLEKIIDGTKEIILAPDTHYLVRVGSLMNICVGSYHQLATSKVCDIAVLKEGESPVVCLEIRGKELVQAKMKHNKRPNDEYRKEIIRWCLDNQLEYINCIDII